MTATLALSIANEISELPRLTQAVGAFLEHERVSREAIDAAQLALDELVANVVRWGHDDDRQHLIRVEAAVEKAQVRLVVEDDGRPFDPSCFPPPDLSTPPEQRAEGGLGIHLVRALAQQVAYRRMAGRNRVEVILDSGRRSEGGTAKSGRLENCPTSGGHDQSSGQV